MRDSINETEVKRLFVTARDVLSAQFGHQTKHMQVDQAKDSVLPSCIVNITIRDCGKLRASMSGYGNNLANAVTMAAKRAAVDERFGRPIEFQDLPTIDLEIWIQRTTRGTSQCC